jgi:hypothetical protein
LTRCGLAAKKDGAAQPCDFAIGRLWNLREDLLRLDVCRQDYLAPFFGFVSDELCEIGRRAGEHGAAHVGQSRLDLGISKGGVDLLVELGDGFPGGVLGGS